MNIENLKIRAARMPDPKAYLRDYKKCKSDPKCLIAVRAKHHHTATPPKPGKSVTTRPSTAPPDPKVWGPPKWDRMHKAAGAVGTMREFRSVFWHEMRTMPGCSCRPHVDAALEIAPMPKTVGRLRLWLWRIHNIINTRLKRPLFSRKAFDKKYPPKGGRRAARNV